jgi:hypothetical protein
MSMFPYIQFFIVFGRALYGRFKDSGISMFKKHPKTKLTTFQKFINLYSGPEVVIHIKYSFILNMVFVSFTFGLALPILFPIALFGVFNMYIMEKL